MPSDPRLGDAKVARIIEAAESVKALGNRTVAAGLSVALRGLEPWVIEVSASKVALPYGSLAFCPLHQRPASPLGTLGIEMGHVYVGEWCPGLFMGFFDPDGDEAVEKWVLDNSDAVTFFISREMDRTQQEIDTRDIRQVDGTNVKPEDMGPIFEHLVRYEGTLQSWLDKIAAGDLFPERRAS